MKIYVFSLIVPFIICSSLVVAQALAGEAGVVLTPELEAGKDWASKICSNCHGLDGQATKGGNSAISPKITAQQKTYLIAKLKDYKSGRIEHPQMSLIAQMLSDEDIDNVSEWYSRIKIDSPWFSEEQASSVMAGDSIDENLTPEAQAGKVKAIQICSNCHGLYGQAVSGGNSVIVPNLTAQQRTKRIFGCQAQRLQIGQDSAPADVLSSKNAKRARYKKCFSVVFGYRDYCLRS